PRPALLIVLIACALRIHGAPGVDHNDWPQFRGPTGQGHSTETGLPIEWSESRNIVWKTPVPGRGWSSPVVADGRIWLTTAIKDKGASLRALAYDVENGRELLNVSCDGSDDAFVAALDKRTGKTRWRASRRQPFDQAYSTPLVIRVGERDEIVSVGAYRAAAYDPQTGKEIWRVSYADGFSNVPRPVYGHGLVYIATGFQQPSLLAVRADGTGDVTKTHI